MQAGGEWLEVRATLPGLLDLGEETPGGPSFEGVMSVVVDDTPRRGIRKLPTLYLGPSPLFSDRDPARLVRMAGETVDALDRSYREPVFLAAPIEVEGRRGLFGRDYNVTSAYRRRLARLGATFASSAFVTLSEEGAFRTGDGETLVPDFVISESVDEPDDGVHRVPPGLLVSQVSMLRLGKMRPVELGLLVRALRDAEGIGAARPNALYEALVSR